MILVDFANVQIFSCSQQGVLLRMDEGHRPPLEVRAVLLLQADGKRHAALPMSMVSLIADA